MNRRPRRRKKNYWGMAMIAMGVGLVMFATIYFASTAKTANTEPSDAMAGVRVVIDPGHGGFDGGTIGTAGTKESEINLAISKLVQKEFESQGAEVVMLRERDEALGKEKQEDMAARRELIETSGQDVTVSIHQNRFEDASVYGPQVFYAPGSVEGEKLAKYVQDSLNEALEVKKASGADGRQLLYRQIRLCAGNCCGMWILSNPEEEAKLKTEAYQKKSRQGCAGRSWRVSGGAEAGRMRDNLCIGL